MKKHSVIRDDGGVRTIADHTPLFPYIVERERSSSTPVTIVPHLATSEDSLPLPAPKSAVESSGWQMRFAQSGWWRSVLNFLAKRNWMEISKPVELVMSLGVGHENVVDKFSKLRRTYSTGSLGGRKPLSPARIRSGWDAGWPTEGTGDAAPSK